MFYYFIFTGKCGVIFKEKVKINSTFYPVSHYDDTREETPNILCCVNPINITEIQLNNNYTSNSTQFNYILLNSTEASYVTDPTVDYYNETVYDEDATFENVTEFYNLSDADARSYFDDIQVNSTIASYVINQTVDYYTETVYTEDMFEDIKERYHQSDEFPGGSGRGTKYSLTMNLFFMMIIFACVI